MHRASRVLAVAGLLVPLVFAVPARPVHAAVGVTPDSSPAYYEPIALQRIPLGQGVTEASSPVFTKDGRHLLFFAGTHLWIVGTDGSGQQCLTCGVAGEPSGFVISEQEGVADEFPDGKRVFFGPPTTRGVLECAPSLLDCRTRRILPVDFSNARPQFGLTFPAGVQALPAYDQGGDQVAKLAPDGVHNGFSDRSSDSIEEMIVARLVRGTSSYVLADPRVINPQPPTDAADRDPQHWSQGQALYEFKTFARGGAAATFVAVGWPAKGNPDVVQVDLATGKTTRLTSNPDWDEDDAPSPDGRSILIHSDRGMHRADALGLLPVPGFADAVEIGVTAAYQVATAARRQCDLQPRLFPASGDDGGALMGQPVQPYDGGDVHAANNISGWQQWSPDGTAIALDTESFTTDASAPYLVVAHLTSRTPTAPLPVVDSEPGAWAPRPQDFHGSLQAFGSFTLHGKASGTVDILQAGIGAAAGVTRVTYHAYSDDGLSFTSGTTNLINTNVFLGPVRIDSDLTMTGLHVGSQHTHTTYVGMILPQGASVFGTEVATLDGTTVTGPAPVTPCPALLPKPQVLDVTASAASSVVKVHVQSTIHGAGAAENQDDTRPVFQATVTAAGRTATTDRAGNAVLAVAGPGPWPVHVTAGDTMRPADLTVRA